MNKGIKYIFLIVSFLTFSTSLYADGIIGKVYKTYNNKNFAPLINNEPQVVDKDVVVDFYGGSLYVKEGSEFKANEYESHLNISLLKGEIRFKLNPQKRVVSFQTPHGFVYTSKIVKSNLALVEGDISIYDKTSTKITINNGELSTYSVDGITNIEQGETVLLAQGNIDQGSNTNVASTYTTPSDLPPGLVEFLSLIGETGDAETKLEPGGEVDIYVNSEKYDGKGKAVDFALLESDEEIALGAPIKVVCANIDDGEENSELYVRKVDRLYPQLFEERILLGKKIIATEDSDNPHGIVEFDEDEIDENTRSIIQWDVVKIDPGTMQPDENATISEDEELDVVCVRSTLVVQPVESANSENVNLIGRKAIAVTNLEPSGTVKVGEKSFNATLVDLNLNPIENAFFPAGSTFTVASVKVNSPPLLLIQESTKVLEEILNVGQKVLTKEDLETFGIVELNGEKWWAKVVGPDLLPITETTYPANTEFIVVGVNTTVLANTSAVLAAAWLTSETFPIALLLLAAVPPAVIIPFIVSDGDDDDDDDDDVVPPPPPPDPEPMTPVI